MKQDGSEVIFEAVNLILLLVMIAILALLMFGVR
jgi:hypothetical protein